MSISSHTPLARSGIWRRLAAIVYDLLAVFALLMLLTGLVIAARRGEPFDSQSVWFRGLLLTACWAYFAWCWTHGGVTLGMRAWRLVLVSRRGGPVALGAATVRFFAALLSALALGLGFVWSLVDRERLTWHDRISRTVLLRRPKLSKPGDGNSGDEKKQRTGSPGGNDGIQ
ncbi:MAG: RDD family protein [Gammaproteobacteria bacterium]